MKAHLAFAALALLFAQSALATGSLVARAYSSPPSSGGYGDNPAPVQSGTSSPASSGTSQSSTGQTGDSQCVATMCVQAIVNASTVQYTLTSQRSAVGWMAMGFGSQMANSPMVIMWANADGSITLSQRQASSEVQPTLVPSPPRVASLQSSLSVTSGNPSFVYTIPANSDTKQNIIWAFATAKPSSSAPDAQLVQHVDSGTLTLDLTKSIGGTASPAPTSSSSSTGGIPLSSSERMIFAHAVIATVGFVLFLPIGALIPRYLRTFIAGPTWFKSHWIVQFLLSGITIIIGVALGISSVSNRGGAHVNSKHKRLGVVLFALYFLQLGVGAFIHWVKPTGAHKRPPQNYLHAILGISIIALALWQIRLGYRNEWPTATGRGAVPNGVNIVWYIWVVMLPVAYGAGMAFLPKQYAQEKKARASSGYHDD